MGKRYRYIPVTEIMPSDYICKHNLLSSKYLRMMSERFPIMLRIELTDNIKMAIYNAGAHLVADDKRRIMDFNYDVIVLIDGRWVVTNELKPSKPNALIAANEVEVLHNQLNLHRTTYGYLTRLYYDKYIRSKK